MSPALAERFERLAWWDWPHERLFAALADFRALEAEAFLERYETRGPSFPSQGKLARPEAETDGVNGAKRRPHAPATPPVTPAACHPPLAGKGGSANKVGDP